MWEVIAQVSTDRSIIITTHSMEVSHFLSLVLTSPGMRGDLHAHWHHGLWSPPVHWEQPAFEISLWCWLST
jgi:hypothetical protein